MDVKIRYRYDATKLVHAQVAKRWGFLAPRLLLVLLHRNRRPSRQSGLVPSPQPKTTSSNVYLL